MVYLLIILGIVVIYLGWYISLTNWSRLTELGVSHKYTSTVYFDGMIVSFLVALVISRVIWMLAHQTSYDGVPWGVLPYIRTIWSIEWFTYFPWRFFKATEGIDLKVLFGIWWVFFSIRTYIPSILLTKKLKVEKKKVTRDFILMAVLGMLVTFGYSALLVYLV